MRDDEMLSKTERLYLQGKKTVNDNYKRKLHHEIKRKVIQAFKDFPLLLNLPKKKQFVIFSDDRLVKDAVSAIQIMWQQAQGFLDEQRRRLWQIERDKLIVTYHGKRIGRLMTRLEEAEIHDYNVSKLNRDADYRREMGRKLRRIERHKI